MAGRRHLPPFHPGVLGWVVVVDEAGGDPARLEALQDVELAVRLRAEELFQRLGERPQGDPAAPIIRRLRQMHTSSCFGSPHSGANRYRASLACRPLEERNRTYSSRLRRATRT